MNKPNILVLLIDQLRTDRLPQFRQFAELKKRGVFCSQMFTYAPYTVASVHALMTGMYGTANGVDSYYGSLDFDKEHCFTLAQYLKESGYSAKADVLSKIVLPHQGFDEVLIHDEFQDDLTRRHNNLIKKAKSKAPFFLLLHYSKIHTGIMSEVVSKFGDFDYEYFAKQKENDARYDRFVEGAANYLDEVMDFCKQESILRDTIIIVLTDHGCSTGARPGEKCYGVFLYDYTVRTFAYFLNPVLLPKNKEINTLTRTIDVVPTILDILKIAPKHGYKHMQGKSLLPAILGDKVDDREAYMETAGLSGPFPSPYKPNICGFRTKEWKLIFNATTGSKELYNIVKDSEETVNLVGQYPEVEGVLWAKIIKEGGRTLEGWEDLG